MRVERNSSRTLLVADSFADLANESSRSRNEELSSSTKARRDDAFYSEPSFEVALETFIQGDARAGDKIESLRERVRSQVGELDVADWRFENSSDGRFLDVASFLAGEQEFMLMALEDTSKRSIRFVKILVDCTFTSDVPKEDILTRGGAILALCDVLNLAGYNTEVWAGISITPSGFSGSKRCLGLLTPVQTRGNVWDSRSAAFPLANGDYLRRLMFGLMEGLPKNERDEFNVGGGYSTVKSISRGDYLDLEIGGADLILSSHAGPIREMVRDPYAWVIQQARALGAITSEGR